VRIEANEGVLRVVFDRPERHNVLDPAATDELRAALAEIAGRPELRLLRLEAEGTTWCAGADLVAVSNFPGGALAAMHAYADMLADLVECPVPVVAVVDGHVRGGGVGLLCAADFVVMGPRATVTLPEARVGLWPMMVGAMLGRVMSARQAMVLALTSEKLLPQECLRLGLATSIGESPAGLADGLAASILRQAPVAIRAGRLAWRTEAGMEPRDLRGRLHALAESLAVLGEGAEAGEGIRAFFEKRAPVW
jgi:enoyl-CoA hydratase